ncbi:MAG: SulP family inorganic anion transporter [Deltaproteobacteria bacterium]|nr:SulP family inorganic anion transporter [Deltaproteobacteria bacterium]
MTDSIDREQGAHPSSAPALAPGASPEPATVRDRWLADLRAGFIVFLIALPLCLGISMASNFPPIAGILTAIIGGMVTVFFGSAKLTVKGPAAGLIAIALTAVAELGEGDLQLGYRRALAVIVVAGLVQIGFSLVRAGVLGDVFPTSVVHGMLAAIGIIIVSKQIHTLLGATPEPGEPLELLAQVPHSVMTLNPEIFAIGLVSLVLLVGVPFIPVPWVKKIPVPMVVVVVAIGMGYLFDLEHEHHYALWAHDYVITPRSLVTLPEHLSSAIVFPDWSVVTSGTSIKFIVMFALVGSIESMLSAKAVETLDPEKERTDINRDLLATGVGTTLAGLIGGLPMISEIVRSSANVNAGARSRWANFFHGCFLLLFVVAAPWLLHRIPTAALAAMLIYTGVRLASPKEFQHAWKLGPEQLVILSTTAIVTLATDLLVGVFAGIAMKIAIHMWNGMSITEIVRPRISTTVEGNVTTLRVGQQAVFANYLTIKRHLDRIPAGGEAVVDLSKTRLVDHTVLEKLHALEAEWKRAGRTLRIAGLGEHRRSSQHPLAMARRAV